MTVEEGTTLAQLVERLLGLRSGSVLAVAVNGQLSSLDYVIQEQDRVDLFPPLAGG